ncbi:hypothetical protein ACZ91_70010, partial [Streptomyces regensis]
MVLAVGVGDTDLHLHDVASPEFLRHSGDVGEDQHRHAGRHVVGHGRGPPPPPVERVGDRVQVGVQAPAVDLARLDEVDLHRRDDAAARTTAAQRPEQLPIQLVGRGRLGAAGPSVPGGEVEGPHVIGGVAVAPAQQSEPAAQRVGHRAHVRRTARQRCQAVWCRR